MEDQRYAQTEHCEMKEACTQVRWDLLNSETQTMSLEKTHGLLNSTLVHMSLRNRIPSSTLSSCSDRVSSNSSSNSYLPDLSLSSIRQPSFDDSFEYPFPLSSNPATPVPNNSVSGSSSRGSSRNTSSSRSSSGIGSSGTGNSRRSKLLSLLLNSTLSRRRRGRNNLNNYNAPVTTANTYRPVPPPVQTKTVRTVTTNRGPTRVNTNTVLSSNNKQSQSDKVVNTTTQRDRLIYNLPSQLRLAVNLLTNQLMVREGDLTMTKQRLSSLNKRARKLIQILIAERKRNNIFQDERDSIIKYWRELVKVAKHSKLMLIEIESKLGKTEKAIKLFRKASSRIENFHVKIASMEKGTLKSMQVENVSEKLRALSVIM